jgi:DNA-binding NarL/FixJ family response regulator
MTRVLIIDDHEVLSDCLAVSLRNQGVDGIESISPRTVDVIEAVASLRHLPEVALVDLDLAGEGAEGLSVIPVLVAKGVTTIAFTGSIDDPTLGRCLESGATGIIQKSLPFARVVELVLAALEGREVNTPADKYQWLLEATRDRNERERSLSPFERLTAREAQVLSGLMRGMHADDIAAANCVSIVTVRSQVRAILQKLGIGSQLAAVAMAHAARWSPPAPVGQPA